VYWRWSGDGDDFGAEVRLLPPFLILLAPGGVGTGWVMTGPTPIPFTAIAQEYVHS